MVSDVGWDGAREDRNEINKTTAENGYPNTRRRLPVEKNKSEMRQKVCNQNIHLARAEDTLFDIA